MANKIEGIYLMTCSLDTVSESEHSQLAGQALRDLQKGNRAFQEVHAQALIDRPRIYEGFQQIGYLGQPFDVIVSNFKKWLQQKGVVPSEHRWNRGFYYKEVTQPTAFGAQKRYVLVYYDTGQEDLPPRQAVQAEAVPAAVEAQAREMLAKQRKIEAIRLVVGHMGWGLDEANKYVDQLEKDTGFSPQQPTEVEVDRAVVEALARELLAQGKKIDAIKVIRQHTGMGLREAVDYLQIDLAC